MKMRVVVLLALLIPNACTNRVVKAKQRYDIVKQGGDADDICREGQKVAEAYLDAHDAQGYSQWKVHASIECMSARQSQSR